jgi:sec-independent protein translocase protein TatA
MFPQLGMLEMIVVMGVAVLLFGKRLPEVGRSLGKGIIEFKKGLRGIEDEFDLSSGSNSSSSGRSSASSRRFEDRGHSTSNDYNESSVPKFEPPTTAPVPQMEYEPQPTQD